MEAITLKSTFLCRFYHFLIIVVCRKKFLSDICAVKIRLHYIMQTGMRSCFFREIFFRTEEPIRVVVNIWRFMKIVILDGYSVNPGDLSWNALGRWGELVVYDRTAPEDIIGRCRGAEIVLTNKVPFSAGTMSQLPALRYIGVLATGYNIIDTKAAAAQGIVVTNIPAYSTESVAQMVFAHILNITNGVGRYAEQNRSGRWSHSADFCYWDTPLVELSGKRMGIVGLGHTGMATARIAHAFGLSVYAYTSKSVDQLPSYVHKASLDELFSECDIVSLHCPLTEKTHHMVDADRLKMMKSSAILINTGRGPLIDELAVAEALNESRLAAFGADVLDVEPARADNPLLTARNSFLTPHIAWATFEARKRLLDICIENVAAFIGGAPIHVVD